MFNLFLYYEKIFLYYEKNPFQCCLYINMNIIDMYIRTVLYNIDK